jgi:hypothetical protein
MHAPVEEISALKEELRQLKAELSALRERYDFLCLHPTLALGMRGERLTARLVGGSATDHQEAYDVVTQQGVKFEVKSAKLAVPAASYSTLRWSWGRIYGMNGNKNYDYLLLIGDTDQRFAKLYEHGSDPFIFFLVPFTEVDELTVKTGSTRSIYLVTNPEGPSKGSRRLFASYQVSIVEIEKRFRFTS